MTQEILQQALIGRCHKDAADRDCPYFARDTLTKAADMLAAIAQPVQPALPSCYSDDADAFIEKHLALRNYPSNSRNAARAGWDAACDLLTRIAQPEQPATSAKPSQEGDAIHNLREAVYAVLSNEDHAFSGGMRSYQKGSQTWQVYEDLRIAAIASQKGEQ